jgi:mono/diheme cytochrome c family protein
MKHQFKKSWFNRKTNSSMKRLLLSNSGFRSVIGFAVMLAMTLAARAEGKAAVSGKANASPLHVNPSQAETAQGTTYLQDVRPIIMGKCVRCHNGEAKFMYNWLDYKTAFNDRREIRRRVWDSWKGAYYKQPMPAGNSPECQSITDEERQTIKQWVDTGAAYGVPSSNPASPKSKEEKIESGKRLFATVCIACHQANGQGIPNQFPPLAQSDFLNSNKDRAIKTLLHGRQGEIVVNGQKFNNSMPSFPLSDDEIASALTFVYHSFGNSGKEVAAEEVKAMRAEPEEATAAPSVASAIPATPFE